MAEQEEALSWQHFRSYLDRHEEELANQLLAPHLWLGDCSADCIEAYLPIGWHEPNCRSEDIRDLIYEVWQQTNRSNPSSLRTTMMDEAIERRKADMEDFVVRDAYGNEMPCMSRQVSAVELEDDRPAEVKTFMDYLRENMPPLTEEEEAILQKYLPRLSTIILNHSEASDD